MTRRKSKDVQKERKRRKSGIIRLMKRGDHSAVFEAVVEYLEKYPEDEFAHAIYGDVAIHNGDYLSAAMECEWLTRHYPDDPDYLLNWIAVADMANLNALKFRHLTAFLERFPTHSEANEVRDYADEVKEDVLTQLRGCGLSDDRLDLAAHADLIQLQLETLHFEEAETMGAAVLAATPQSASVRTVYASAILEQGRLEEAFEHLVVALTCSPDYLYALDLLTRCHLLFGNTTEARAVAHRMQQLYATIDPLTCARALAISADYSALHELFLTTPHKQFEVEDRALFRHFGAVASARLGDLKRARSLWKKALKRDPELIVARLNLEDLDLPADEQNGAWAADISQVIPNATWQQLYTTLEASRERGEAQAAAVDSIVSHPIFRPMARWMLENGDSATVRLGLISTVTEPPEQVRELLVAFAGGRHGDDQVRMETYEFLVNARQIPPGPHPIWLNGKLRSNARFLGAINGNVSEIETDYDHDDRPDDDYQGDLFGPFD